MNTAQKKKIDALVAKLRAAEAVEAAQVRALNEYSAETTVAADIAASAAASALAKKRLPKYKSLKAKTLAASSAASKTSTAATAACAAAGLNMTQTMAVLFPET